MKKTFLFLTLSTLLITARAQVKFGAKAGINVSTITGKDVDGYRSKTGFHLGGFANLPLASQLSVQAELVYSSQGARWDDDNEKTTLNYLQIPLLAKYTTTTGFYAEAGFQAGLLLKAEDDNEGDVYSIKEAVKKADFSLALGGGYNINTNIGVNVRYNLGLVKFYGEEKNSVFQVGVTYTFSNRAK